MSKPDTWMPLYIGDYIRDTTRLTTEQHGAYLLLIMDYWMSGPLPDDDGALATITRLTASAWRKHRPTLQRLFTVADGFWRHKRIDEEYAKATALNDKQRKNGSKGGRPVKNKNPDESQDITQKKPMGYFSDNPNENPTGNPDHKPDESPSPSPSQTPLKPTSTPAASTSEPPQPEPVLSPPPDDSVPIAKVMAGRESELAEPQPPDADQVSQRAIGIVVLLKRHGIILPSANPILRGWAERGVPNEKLLAAIEMAKERRSAENSDQPIGAGFIDALLRSPLQRIVGAGANRQVAQEERNHRVADGWVPPEMREANGESGEVVDA